MVGRREDDNRFARLEIEVGKLSDHLDEIDDHLRGVAGRDSLDTRVTLLEKEYEMHGIMLRRISDQFTDLLAKAEGLKQDLSRIKISQTVAQEIDQTKLERFKEWLKFWGPILLAVIALLTPWVKEASEGWREHAFQNAKYSPDQRLRKQIEADKRKALARRQVKNRP